MTREHGGRPSGGPLFGDLGANVPAAMMALQIQKGAQPFVYDYSAKPKDITIKMDDQASKDVLSLPAVRVTKGRRHKERVALPLRAVPVASILVSGCGSMRPRREHLLAPLQYIL